MGIYIKGMNMPYTCDGCYIREHNTCPLLKVNVSGWGRVIDCPLIEIPPHGDLISREWLIDIALHLMNTAKNEDIANGVKWLWQYIIEATTIIPAEEGE